jgi:hypothetical protein
MHECPIVRVWAEYEADISASAVLFLGEGGVIRSPVTRERGPAVPGTPHP